MDNIYLLDSSIWIQVLRFNPAATIQNRVDRLLKENAVAIMPIVKVELLGGAKNNATFERLNKRLDSLICLDIGPKLWDETCRLAYNLRRSGITVPYIDTIIAATAIHHDTILLHLDKHFDMIASNSSLKAENCSDNLPPGH